MISMTRMDANPALIDTQKKERKTFLPPKNHLTTMIMRWMQFYYLLSLRLLDVNINLKY